MKDDFERSGDRIAKWTIILAIVVGIAFCATAIPLAIWSFP